MCRQLHFVCTEQLIAKAKTPSPEPPPPSPKAAVEAVAEMKPPSDLHAPPKEVKMEDLSVSICTHVRICQDIFICQDDEDDAFDEDGDVFVASGKGRFNKFGKEGTKQA